MIKNVQLLDVEDVKRRLQVLRKDIAGVEFGGDSPNPAPPAHVALSDGMALDVNGPRDIGHVRLGCNMFGSLVIGI